MAMMSGTGPYRPRLVDSKIQEFLEIYGAVCIEGPMRCGKTTVASTYARSRCSLEDERDNRANLDLARIDVNYALEGEKPHLIDEWQTVPQIWDAVRRRVDETTEKGQFILCGSSVVDDRTKDGTETIHHSGFGRICRVHMRTMSLFESGDSDGSVSLSALFDGGPLRTPMREITLDRLVNLTMRGGWPGNLGLSDERAILAVSRYPDTICQHDVRRVDPTKNGVRVRMLMRSLARNESTLASNTTIAKDLKEYDDETMAPATVSDYIGILDRLFLVENQPAFDPNIRSSLRVGKMAKRHLTDPALSIAALGMTRRELSSDLNTFGLMFEGLCERDLQIYASAHGGRLFHYRDGRGNEIDAVVEMPDGRWGAFEIKLGMGQVDEAAQNLIALREILLDDLANHVPGKPKARPPEILAVICGMAPAAYQREDGVYVIPITMLRD